MKKKKLLIAADSFLPRWDGISRFLAETVPRLARHYDIRLIVPEFRGKKAVMKNVEITRIPVHSFMAGDYHPPKIRPFTIRKYVKEADVVFTQSIGPIGGMAMIWADRLRKPLYAYAHSLEWELVPKSIDKFKRTISALTKSFARYVYNKCDFIFVPSSTSEKSLKYAGISPQMRVIPLGVNTSLFRPPKSKRNARKRAGLSQNSVVVGFVGRIAREKDLPTLYRAFRSVKKKNERLRLLIIGKGIELSTMFDDMTGIKHVEVSNDVRKYYQAMDIFVMPSLTETSSLATMEAMSCGLSVVATPVGGMQEYISDGRNGYLFPAREPSVLARKLSKLADNEDLRRAIGSMARKTITSAYSWDRTVKEISEMLG